MTKTEDLQKLKDALRKAGIPYSAVAMRCRCRIPAVHYLLAGKMTSARILRTIKEMIAEKQNQTQTTEA